LIIEAGIFYLKVSKYREEKEEEEEEEEQGKWNYRNC
jgi:hypothetical protein